MLILLASCADEEQQLFSVFEPPPPVEDVSCQATGEPSPWSPFSLQTENGLADIWGSADDDVWAVGGAGTLLHFDGSDWSDHTQTWPDILGVSGVASDHIWVVGRQGLVARYDGVWERFDSGTTEALTDVWVTERDTVWIIGASGVKKWTAQGLITDPSWPKSKLNAIWASGAGDLRIVADTETHHYDGSRFTTEAVEKAGRLSAIWGSDAQHVWVLGHNVSARPGFAVLEEGHWRFTAAPARAFFFSTWSRDGKTLWAGADRTTIYRRANNEWCYEYLAGVGAVTAFWGASHHKIWAVGAKSENDQTRPVLLRRSY